MQTILPTRFSNKFDGKIIETRLSACFVSRNSVKTSEMYYYYYYYLNVVQRYGTSSQERKVVRALMKDVVIITALAGRYFSSHANTGRRVAEVPRILNVTLSLRCQGVTGGAQHILGQNLVNRSARQFLFCRTASLIFRPWIAYLKVMDV